MYSQCGGSKISHNFFAKLKVLADMKYMHFLLFFAQFSKKELFPVSIWAEAQQVPVLVSQV